jgi:hypothetical protein
MRQNQPSQSQHITPSAHNRFKLSTINKNYFSKRKYSRLQSIYGIVMERITSYHTRASLAG